MFARITPRPHGLPHNNAQMMFFNGSKQAHELPPKDFLKDILKDREGQVHKLLCTSAPFIGGAE